MQDVTFVKSLDVIIDRKLTWKNYSSVHKNTRTIGTAALIAKLHLYK